ncbi:site-2 protease family protein [Actinomadura harenae]|uniref:Zinc metalloprotease n=1 Tax=Actinomadura harenae TaxID=2483351 RepID=A0A3M2M383_9ACTN|nr:site-2 protease family protein [Actinomadura harenae]RMI44059.1 site-2 protease family protein [Actinomadura harenae]
MKQNIRLGTIAGIPVGLHWSVLVIMALITWGLAYGVLPPAQPGLPVALYLLAALLVALVFLCCLVAHELAHCVVAVRSGVRVKSITLWMLGGVSELEAEAPTPRSDLAIAIAGPATSLLLGLLCGVATVLANGWHSPRLLAFSLGWLAATNLLLGVFNLLPGAPLDGGRVLRALLWGHYGNRARADKAATGAGRLIGAALMGLGVVEVLFVGIAGLWLLLLGWFLMRASQAEETVREVRGLLDGLTAADVMTPQPEVAAAWSTVADFTRRVVDDSRQSVFPVVDVDGRPVGILDLAALDRHLASGLASSRVDAVASAVPPEYRVAPSVPVMELLGRRPLAGGVLALLVEDGHLLGMVTVGDIDRAIRRRRLTTEEPGRPEE